MRSSKSRSRNKQRNRSSVGNVVNRVFDSSGPEGKVRGTPQQIIDKYNQLARDSQVSGDRVATENFQQHAEHYTRMLAEAQREQNERREQQEQQQRDRQQRHDDHPGSQQPRRADDDSAAQPRDRQPRNDEPHAAPPRGGDDGRHQHQMRRPEPDQDGQAGSRDVAAQQEPAPAADPASQPQPDTAPKPRRSRPRKAAVAADTPSDVIDLGADDGESGLVETPEEKPKRKPRARKPKADKPDTEGDPKSDATAAE